LFIGEWPFTKVAEIAVPFDRLRTVSPDTSVTQALAVMVREDVNQLPVVSDARLIGIVSRGNVLQFFQTQSETEAA
jgi:CBS domain-containing protein